MVSSRAGASHVVARRFLPGLTVAHAFRAPRTADLPVGRACELDGSPNVFLAGDWVGSEGMLADASAASAARRPVTCSKP